MASRLGCLHTVTDYLYDEEEIQAYRRRSSPATMHALFSVVYSSEDPPAVSFLRSRIEQSGDLREFKVEISTHWLRKSHLS
jgi:hypothetical protein